MGIDDVERARRLLAASPVAKGEGSLFVVTIDDERARILDFDLDVAGVVDSERRVNDDDTRSRHLRTVQRHTGHDDERDLVQFFDTVAAEIRGISPIPSFVLLGHGTGTSNAAEQFLRRLETAHEDVASHVRAIGTIDLSAASDGEIEKAAESILGGA